MDNIGIINEIDALGRHQNPKEIRKRLGLGERVEPVITRDGLLIKSPELVLVSAEKRK